MVNANAAKTEAWRYLIQAAAAALFGQLVVEDGRGLGPLTTDLQDTRTDEEMIKHFLDRALERAKEVIAIEGIGTITSMDDYLRRGNWPTG